MKEWRKANEMGKISKLQNVINAQRCVKLIVHSARKLSRAYGEDNMRNEWKILNPISLL